MELSRIIELLPHYIAAGVCVEIRGRSGIGKTDMVRQFVFDQNRRSGRSWGVGAHFAATWTPPDVTGYLMPRTVKVTMPDGSIQEQTISEWSAPVWLRADPGQASTWLNDFDVPVLVFEEFDKANPEVKKAAAPVILYGGVGGWYLKRGAARIILSNHADDGRQGSTKEFDFVINRKILLHATQTVAAWLDWADRNSIHPMFKAFAEQHPVVVFSGDLPEKQGPYCTPRSLMMLESVAKNGLITPDGALTHPDDFTEVANGAIGAPAARDLVTFLKFKDDIPDWSEIVRSPGKAKVSSNAGAQLMSAHFAAYNVDEQTIEQGVTYVKRLRPEFHITFAKAATRRNFRLVNTKPFAKWTNDQPQLVALINALGGAR
jgi:hypothetical protein